MEFAMTKNAMKKTKNRIILSLIVIVVILSTIIFLYFICPSCNEFLTKFYNYPMLGFTEYKYIKNNDLEIITPRKYVWDWLELLIVPLVISLAAILFDVSIKNKDREIADKKRKQDLKISEARNREARERNIDQYQENRLLDYFSKIEALLNRPNFQEYLAQANDIDPLPISIKKLQSTYISRTLTTLRTLNGTRKGLLLKYLFDNDLITGENPFIKLDYADCSYTKIRRNTSFLDSNFKNVDLPKSNLNMIELIGADLSRTDFKDSVFEEGRFINCKFNKTKLGSTSLEEKINCNGVNVQGSKFYNVLIQGRSFINSQWNNCDFYGCEIKYSDFRNAQLNNFRFLNNNDDLSEENEYFPKENRMFDVNFDRAKFHNCDFSDAELSHVKFTNSEIVDAIFNGAYLNNVDFNNSSKLIAKFCDSTLENVSFKNIVEINSDFSDSHILNVWFDRTNEIVSCQFRNCTMENVCFDHVIRIRSDFSNSKMKEIKFRYVVDLQESQFNSVNNGKIYFYGSDLPDHQKIQFLNPEELEFFL